MAQKIKLHKETASSKRILRKAKKRREELINAFLHERRITKGLFEERMAQLDTSITETEGLISKLELQCNDQEDNIDSLSGNLRDLASAWISGNLGQRIALQNALFPDGLLYKKEDGFKPPPTPTGFFKSY